MLSYFANRINLFRVQYTIEKNIYLFSFIFFHSFLLISQVKYPTGHDPSFLDVCYLSQLKVGETLRYKYVDIKLILKECQSPNLCMSALYVHPIYGDTNLYNLSKELSQLGLLNKNYRGMIEIFVQGDESYEFNEKNFVVVISSKEVLDMNSILFVLDYEKLKRLKESQINPLEGTEFEIFLQSNANTYSVSIPLYKDYFINHFFIYLLEQDDNKDPKNLTGYEIDIKINFDK